MTASRARIPVIGAGMAGATCASELSNAGTDVHLLKKSRGVGGRMATRRIRLRDAAQREHEIAFDHGAPGFPVSSGAFARFVNLHVESRTLVRWLPRMASGSFVPFDGYECWMGSDRMPDVCSRLLDGFHVTLSCAVDTIRRGPVAVLDVDGPLGRTSAGRVGRRLRTTGLHRPQRTQARPHARAPELTHDDRSLS